MRIFFFFFYKVQETDCYMFTVNVGSVGRTVALHPERVQKNAEKTNRKDLLVTRLKETHSFKNYKILNYIR